MGSIWINALAYYIMLVVNLTEKKAFNRGEYGEKVIMPQIRTYIHAIHY